MVTNTCRLFCWWWRWHCWQPAAPWTVHTTTSKTRSWAAFTTEATARVIITAMSSSPLPRPGMHRNCLRVLCPDRRPEDDKHGSADSFSIDDAEIHGCMHCHPVGRPLVPVVDNRHAGCLLSVANVLAQEAKALLTGHVYYGQGLLQCLFLSVRPVLTSSPSS